MVLINSGEFVCWRCSFALVAAAEMPLCGVQGSIIVEHAGVKIGLVGLVERDWAETLPCIEPEEVSLSSSLPKPR